MRFLVLEYQVCGETLHRRQDPPRNQLLAK